VSGRRGFDRVGGSRLTGLGTALVLAVVIVGANQPRTTDREILAVVVVAALGALVVGIAWPLVAVRRLSVRARSPRDATVGDLVPIEVEVTGRARGAQLRTLDPTGAWHRLGGPGTGTVVHLADRRGLFFGLRVEVRCTAPLGVLAAHRVFDIALPFAVEVAPQPLAVDWLPSPAPIEGNVHAVAHATTGGDLARSVRPYVSGDPAHLVHWPSTARTGQVVVRELEPPAPLGQAIVVDLRDLGPETERAASYAFGAARAVLAAGGELVLCTAEAGGPVTGRVRSSIDAGRRLARAVPGPPGEPPAGWPVVEIGR
jgi:uncharacterized protein (DUF58 family)